MSAPETVFEQILRLLMLAIVAMARGAYALSLWAYREIETYALDRRRERSE